MHRLSLLLVWFVVLVPASADTLHFRNRGGEVNGKVTLTKAGFVVEARFRTRTQTVMIATSEISELRCNDVEDNPQDEAPDWMLSMARSPSPTNPKGTIKFWDHKKPDMSGPLQSITDSLVTIEGQPAIPRADVESVMLLK